MATATRRARIRRAHTVTASAAVLSVIVITFSAGIVAHSEQPLAILPLTAALVALALVEWPGTCGFIAATSLGLAAIAVGCAALAVAL
ncbi:hypothetical protein [Microbacterium sp. KNMS]